VKELRISLDAHQYTCLKEEADKKQAISIITTIGKPSPYIEYLLNGTEIDCYSDLNTITKKEFYIPLHDFLHYNETQGYLNPMFDSNLVNQSKKSDSSGMHYDVLIQSPQGSLVSYSYVSMGTINSNPAIFDCAARFNRQPIIDSRYAVDNEWDQSSKLELNLGKMTKNNVLKNSEYLLPIILYEKKYPIQLSEQLYDDFLKKSNVYNVFIKEHAMFQDLKILRVFDRTEAAFNQENNTVQKFDIMMRTAFKIEVNEYNTIKCMVQNRLGYILILPLILLKRDM
jgi:hypothetical protein